MSFLRFSRFTKNLRCQITSKILKNQIRMFSEKPTLLSPKTIARIEREKKLSFGSKGKDDFVLAGGDGKTKKEDDKSLFIILFKPALILACICGTIGFFVYKSHIEGKLQKQVVEEINGRITLSASECYDLADNDMDLNKFAEISDKLAIYQSTGITKAEALEIIEEVINPLKYPYYFDRTFDQFSQRYNNKIPIDVIKVFIMHMMRGSTDNVGRLTTIYSLYTKGDTMTKDEFTRVIELLNQTSNFPTQFLVKKINGFPFPSFAEYNSAELCDEAINLYRKTYKDIEKRYENRLKKHEKEINVFVPPKPSELVDDNSISLNQYLEMLLDRPLCIWGTCLADDYYY